MGVWVAGQTETSAAPTLPHPHTPILQGMLFERTALSRKPEELARQELATLRDQDRMTPDLVFRDPCLLDFLGLADTYSEKDPLGAACRRHRQSAICTPQPAIGLGVPWHCDLRWR